MEGLSNSNFLKVIDVKKNSDDTNIDKKLTGNEKSFIIDKVDNIEAKIKNILNNEEPNIELDEEVTLLGKEKNKKLKKRLNIEQADFLLPTTNIRTSENKEISDNEKINYLDNISIQNHKKKKSLLNNTKDSLLDISSSNKKEKSLTNNMETISNIKTIKNDLVNSIFNNPKFDPKNTKTNKFNLDTLGISNTGKKSRIKSFFQNYFNYALKKYSKKNINLKKSHFVNSINYNSKNQKEDITLTSNNNIKSNYDTHIINKKTNMNFDNTTREQINFNESNIKPSNDKNPFEIKENSFDKFDRLKNILDIRSNDIKQRFSQILENNIKMNNNKFEIQLRPENLGKIQITLEITGQNVDININSDNINAIQSLTENNSNLQKMLQNHGMNLNNFNFNGNNNKGLSKDSKNSKSSKNEDVSVNNKEINDDSSFVSNKLVYAKA